VSDITLATSIPVADAEQTIQRKDPLEWLKSGPGRWSHPEGTWQSPASKIDAEAAPPTVAIAEQSTETLEDDVDLLADAPTVRDLPAALMVLRESGLGYVIDEAEECLSIQAETQNNRD